MQPIQLSGEVVGPNQEIIVGPQIDAGSTGLVYQATYRPKPEFPIAVKFYADSDEAGSAAFMQGALMQARMQHDNVMPCYYANWLERSWKQIPYAVMPYADSGNLHTLCRGHNYTLPLMNAMDMYLQSLAGLAHVHEQNIIHRDFKPGNILLQKDPDQPSGYRAKLSDFGLAIMSRVMHGSHAALAEPLYPAGTPTYMPPEQFEGFPELPSDVYAAGVFGYFLITGKMPVPISWRTQEPLADQIASAVEAHRAAVIPSIAQGRRTLPLALIDLLDDVIVGKALAKEPAARQQSAGELHDDIERAYLVGSERAAREAAVIVMSSLTVAEPNNTHGEDTTDVR